MKLLLILLTGILLTCSSEEIKQASDKASPVIDVTSCSFDLLDGECTRYKDDSYLCSMGKCTEGDCINGKGMLTYSKGSFLEATFNKGKVVEGPGSFNKCGDKFEGIFSDTISKGMHTYSNSSTYEGTVIKGSREGYGIFKDNYNVYSGNWKSNRKHGKGVLTTNNGNWVYEGDWKFDRMDGKGVLTVANKVYEGTWKDDKMDGKFKVKDEKNGTEKAVTYIDGQDDEQRERNYQAYREMENEMNTKRIREKELRQFIYKMFELGARDLNSCEYLCAKYKVKDYCYINCKDAMEINR